MLWLSYNFQNSTESNSYWGISFVLTLISERHRVEPVPDKPASLRDGCLQAALSKTRSLLVLQRENDMKWGEKCHNLCPAGLDYPTSKVYPPAAPVSHYKSSPCWTSGQTGVWFIGWMLLPGSRRSLCLSPVIVIMLSETFTFLNSYIVSSSEERGSLEYISGNSQGAVFLSLTLARFVSLLIFKGIWSWKFFGGGVWGG